ncbi:MAG: MraY family glycosyltransferase [Patescibacteria group bacterium]|mgnify:CR=1 FL=1
MFDLRLLSASHFIFLLLSFAVGFAVLLRWHTKFAGIIPATVATILSVVFLGNTILSVGLLLAYAVIVIVGRADEKEPLSPAAQLFWQLLVSVILVVCGWNIPYVSNPLGYGVIELGALSFPLTVAWIMLMMNAMNWLDGVDGLAALVGSIGFITLAAVSALPATQDTATLGLALVGAGAFAGFFLHNAPPARFYLGTVGSWFLGAFLALTAAFGGGKVATATLVLALPVLDAFFVIGQRLLSRQKPWQGDKKHLHFRLASLGWKVPHIVLASGVVSATLGVIAVTAQTREKLWVLGIVALFLLLTILSLLYLTYAGRKTAHR